MLPVKSRDVIVVRRGLSAEYYFFTGVTAQVNGAEFVVDRRSGERRTASEAVSTDRRATDRRRPPQGHWIHEDAILAHGAAAGAGSRPRAGWRSFLW